MVTVKIGVLTVIAAALVIVGCVKEKLPHYDGKNASLYWQAHCQDKPEAIQDLEPCRKSGSQMRIDRLNKTPIRNW